MIQVRELEKYYAGKKALGKINFTVEEGEILGFLGPNGAGKSTTMNIITGYIAPTNGTVFIDGFDIVKQSKKAKSKIGYLPEQPPLYIDMTVKSYLSFIYDLKKVKLNKKEHIKEICEKVKITDVSNRVIKKLSKGYKQRVGIAQALIGYPPVIILDEPTVGLDPKQVIGIRNLIKDLANNHTVIFSSHILSEVQAVCSRILVINKGEIVADNPAELLSKDSNMSNEIVAQVEGDVEKVKEVILSIDGVLEISNVVHKEEDINEYIIVFEKGIDVRRDIFKSLAQNDMPIIKFDVVEPSLEDVFIKLTSNQDNEVSEGTDDVGYEVAENEVEEVTSNEDSEDSNKDSYENSDENNEELLDSSEQTSETQTEDNAEEDNKEDNIESGDMNDSNI